MKVVHVSTTDYGGAFRAAQRINECLIEKGIDSQIIVRTKTRKNDDIIEIIDTQFKRIISKSKNFINNVLAGNRNVKVDCFGTDISRNEIVKNADIVVLHAVNSFIPYRGVEKLNKVKGKIFWVLHDMSLFTGGCHYDLYCDQYMKECNNCQFYKKMKILKIATRNLKRKMKMAEKINLTVISPSNWMNECAKNSRVLKNNTSVVIHNPIDIDLFKPLLNKSDIRKKYGVTKDKKIILFGATQSTNNPIKGLAYLYEAINSLNSNEYELLIFGNANKKSDKKNIYKIPAKYLGIIDEDAVLCEIYNMADVFVAPSEQDNYPNTVLEASAAGTPVVAFNIAGMSDLIDHKKSGYLAKYKNIDDLKKGIEFCCLHSENLGRQGRKKVETINTYECIANQYYDLMKKDYFNNMEINND